MKRSILFAGALLLLSGPTAAQQMVIQKTPQDSLATAPAANTLSVETLDRRESGIDTLRRALRDAVDTTGLYHGDVTVSNSRHYEALTAAREALHNALQGLQTQLPADLLSEEIRQVIRRLGTITGRGEILPDEILQNIFSKFCIGK